MYCLTAGAGLRPYRLVSGHQCTEADQMPHVHLSNCTICPEGSSLLFLVVDLPQVRHPAQAAAAPHIHLRGIRVRDCLCSNASHFRSEIRTGRIGSREQLAENAWLVSLECSRGRQWYCVDHLYQIELGFKGKPELRKIGQFSLYACGNGVSLPHVAKHAFGDQMGPNMQKAMLFGSPPHQGLNNCGISPKK